MIAVQALVLAEIAKKAIVKGIIKLASATLKEKVSMVIVLKVIF